MSNEDKGLVAVMLPREFVTARAHGFEESNITQGRVLSSACKRALRPEPPSVAYRNLLAFPTNETWSKVEAERERLKQEVERLKDVLLRLGRGCRVRNVHEDWPALDGISRQAIEMGEP
jgi:hypothetical protein